MGTTTTSNGPLQTVAGQTDMNTRSSPARPVGFGSNLEELNVSQLSETDNTIQQEGRSKRKKKVDTPNNELSLEAELSAAFAFNKSGENDLSLDEDIIAASTPKSEMKDFPGQENEPLFGQTGSAKQDERTESNETLDNTSDSKVEESLTPLKKSKAKDIDKSTIILEDESFSDSPVPDIVATSLVKSSEPSPDFMTSTPKKPEGNEEKSGLGDSTQYQSMSDNSSQYVTALSSQQTTNASMDQHDSSKDDSEDFSFLGEKKFAALLQTVAPPSFVEDDSEMMSSSFGSTNLDKTHEEIFDRQTPTPGDNDEKVPSPKMSGDANISTVTLQPGNASQQEAPLLSAQTPTEQESKEEIC